MRFITIQDVPDLHQASLHHDETSMKMQASYSPLSPIGSVSPWAFWALGLLNNSTFVIMVASAKSISEGGTALVFLSTSLPSLIVKLSAPYWFDRVSYDKRMMVASALMMGSFGIVASFAAIHHSRLSLYMQLLGCAFVSIQCGMGEASLLALAGKSDIGRGKNACLTAFSSGTGLAGVFGFMWNFVWIDWLRLPLSFSLYLGNVLPILYYGLYYTFVREIPPGTVITVNLCPGLQGGEFSEESSELPVGSSSDPADVVCGDGLVSEEVEEEDHAPSVATREIMTSLQRLVAVLRLWPYMIPLFVVYAAEYSLQAGTWTAIGFPVDDEAARRQFYEYSNWMYQVGVFLSRSSGVLFVAPLSILWLMPALQVVNVFFFWFVAKYQAWYNYFLLIPAFYVGLLGGGVYINGYVRICTDLSPERREFALSSTSIAEGLGIVCADVVGLFLQACLYQIHSIKGAMVSCPLRNP